MYRFILDVLDIFLHKIFNIFDEKVYVNVSQYKTQK